MKRIKENNLFSRLEDRGLIIRNVLDVSPPYVCGIFRSGLSGKLQHSIGRKGEGKQKEAGLQRQRCCRP